MTTVGLAISTIGGGAAAPSDASDLVDGGGRAFKKHLSSSNSSTSTDDARQSSMGPYQRQASAGVSQELRNRLASVGMHARFNVNRGYASPPIGLSPACSSTDPFGTNSHVHSTSGAPIFMSSRDTTQAVSRTRSKWSRTSSAPSTSTRELQPYGGSVKLGCLSSAGEEGEEDDQEDGFDPSVLEHRPFVGASATSGVLQHLQQQQTLGSPGSASFGLDLKRGRDEVRGSFMDEDEDGEGMMMAGASGLASPASSAGLRPVQPLPSRRPLVVGLGNRSAASAGFSRGAAGASTMPVGSSRMMDFMEAQKEDQISAAASAWEQHDFSTAAQRMEEF